MYDIAVRKLAMRMVSQIGILKTSVFTNISRSTLWRWKRFGVDRKRRTFESKLFETSKDFLKAFLLSTQYTTATGIITFFKNVHNVRLSAKTVYRFIKLLGFTRKRSKVRGQSKGDLAPLVEYLGGRVLLCQDQQAPGPVHERRRARCGIDDHASHADRNDAL